MVRYELNLCKVLIVLDIHLRIKSNFYKTLMKEVTDDLDSYGKSVSTGPRVEINLF